MKGPPMNRCWPCFLSILMAAACSGAAPEPVAESSAAASAYNILVIQLFRAGTPVTWPAFQMNGPFGADVRRISYVASSSPDLAGFSPQFNILPPLGATPAQIGCGSGNDQRAAMQYAVGQAVASGVNFAPYRHVWLAPDNQHSLQPECAAMYGTSGGKLVGYAGIPAGLGGIWGAAPDQVPSNTAVHEFEHGLGPEATVSHVQRIDCLAAPPHSLVSSANCAVTEVAPNGVPSALDALGGDPGNWDPLYNENAEYKRRWGWIGPARVATFQPGQSGDVATLNYSDQAQPGAGFLVARVVRPDGRVFVFDRRSEWMTAQNGMANNPGLTVYLVEADGIPKAMTAPPNLGSGGYWGHLRSWPNNYSVNVEPGFDVQNGSVANPLLLRIKQNN